MGRIIAVANQKGGVGKTTTAVNLCAALADLGHNTLLVDMDPQGNAATGAGIDPRVFEISMYQVLLGAAELTECIRPTGIDGFEVAPARLEMSGAEIELVSAFSRELKLRHALAPVADDYDYIFIDCPPSLGLLTVNALSAATEILVPVQCEYYALEGLGQLLHNVEMVREGLNSALVISAIVMVMYDARTRLAAEVVSDVRRHFGDRVCRVVVPRTVRLSEAPSVGQPVTVYAPKSRGAIAYQELAREIHERGDPHQAAADRTGDGHADGLSDRREVAEQYRIAEGAPT
ncbi:ParA family protein [Candidatus Poriferisodalis sp.]|uniref:ParA family protein n=1 Tax=Candidatus Poriferisodalis sp. TaxID=3101277 RepID=UPI003B5BF8DD